MFSNEHLVAILAALPDPAFVLTRSGVYAGIFGGADVRYYHDGSMLVGRRIDEVLNAEKAAWFLGRIAHALDSGGMEVVEYPLAVTDVRGLALGGPDEPIWFEGRIQKLGFPVGGEDAVLWVASNITERHALEMRLRAQSETDELTGMPNRRHFEKRVTSELQRSGRHGHPLTVLIFDIDHFKIINDTCGHPAGDEVLVAVAVLVRQQLREADLLTRWGGEEFTVLMPDTPLATALRVADKLRAAIESHRFAFGLQVTISIGAAQWEGQVESLHALMSRADEALYLAKHRGRNRVEAAAPGMLVAAPLARVPPGLQWRRHYESGHAVIDVAHRGLFEGAAMVQRMLADGAAQTSLVATLGQLAEQVLEHFAIEAEELKALSWSGTALHLAEHERLAGEVVRLHGALGDSPEAFDELIRFLAIDVIANHMLRADRQFFPLIAGATP